ncbi:unnamed protein product [Closterium sp. Naga37s-1]|nr:unnamed protein product [Closterium sp. Naga37s-1]
MQYGALRCWECGSHVCAATAGGSVHCATARGGGSVAAIVVRCGDHHQSPPLIPSAHHRSHNPFVKRVCVSGSRGKEKREHVWAGRKGKMVINFPFPTPATSHSLASAFCCQQHLSTLPITRLLTLNYLIAGNFFPVFLLPASLPTIVL